MSHLVLIRHGQARAFDADSDRLSDLGKVQARKLGAYFVERGIQFDEVVTGPLQRQTVTAELVGEVFAAARRPWPEARVDPAWSEYDSTNILATLLPALATQDEPFRALVEAFASATTDRNRHFQRMFEVLTDRWQRGTLTAEGVEPFSTFHGRVTKALAEVTDVGDGRTVAVFTSGGPIGVCVQQALDAPPRAALRLNWRVKNASLTRFVFSKGRLSLDSFNELPHLDSPLQSFR